MDSCYRIMTRNKTTAVIRQQKTQKYFPFYKICLYLVRGLVDRQGAVIKNCKLFWVKASMSQTHRHRHKQTYFKDFHLCCARFYLISNNEEPDEVPWWHITPGLWMMWLCNWWSHTMMKMPKQDPGFATMELELRWAQFYNWYEPWYFFVLLLFR